MATEDLHARNLDRLLTVHLSKLIGAGEPATIELLRGHLQWVELSGGETLMRQGDAGDSMYLTVSGRLRAYIGDDAGSPRLVRELARGQVVGEMSLFTDEPRSATVVAIRDSVLVRLKKDDFKRLIAASSQVAIALTRQIIHRLRPDDLRGVTERPVTIGLLAVTGRVELHDFATTLVEHLQKVGTVALVDAASIDSDLATPGIANRERSDIEANRRIALRLDEIEANHDFVLLLGDTTATAWTQRCSRHSDELYLLADADQPAVVHPIEAQCLRGHASDFDPTEILVLLHPADRHSPDGTERWLARRKVADHLHIRPALARDMARLARLISRTGVGLVFAGGGARGLAHIGVYRALLERGIEIDVVGGTSIGSVIATYVAADGDIDTITANAREAFATNPTGDFNLLPLISLVKGLRLRRVVAAALRALTGFESNAEDLWKTYFCVVTNYSQACEQVVRSGPLLDAMLASIAIPGALPPLISNGDLLCDGGTFNNFPVDVMRNMRGVGQVIGVDLGTTKPVRIDHAAMPGTWDLLIDRLRPRKSRRFRLPSLSVYLMGVTVLYSNSRQRDARKLTDVYLNPPLDGIGMLQWHRFDEIIAQGYKHACDALDATEATPPAPPPGS